MINYKFRSLSGFYKGSFGNQFADFIKISNGMQELAIDLPLLDGRITTLENSKLGILATGNFINNSISGSIILDGTLNGSKIQDGTITGAQIVINSINGLTDANISANANINPAKINLGLISHTQLKDIGVNTHATIDSELAQLFSDVGSTPSHPLALPLATSVNNNTTAINNINSNLSTLTSFVNQQPLTTTAQTVAPAINELRNGLALAGVSGYGVVGPNTVTQTDIATWGTDNRHLLDSSAQVDSTGNITVNSSLYTTNNGGGSSLGTAGQPFTNLNIGANINFQHAGTINAASNSDLTINTSSQHALNIVTPSGTSITIGNMLAISNMPLQIEEIYPSGNAYNSSLGMAVNYYAQGFIDTVNTGSVHAKTGQDLSLVSDLNAISLGTPQGNQFVISDNNHGFVGSFSTVPYYANQVGSVLDPVASGTFGHLYLQPAISSYYPASIQGPSSGLDTIPSGASHIFVNTVEITSNTLVFLTRADSNDNDSQGIKVSGSPIPGSGFHVKTLTGSNANGAIGFNWLIIN